MNLRIVGAMSRRGGPGRSALARRPPGADGRNVANRSRTFLSAHPLAATLAVMAIALLGLVACGGTTQTAPQEAPPTTPSPPPAPSEPPPAAPPATEPPPPPPPAAPEPPPEPAALPPAPAPPPVPDPPEPAVSPGQTVTELRWRSGRPRSGGRERRPPPRRRRARAWARRAPAGARRHPAERRALRARARRRDIRRAGDGHAARPIPRPSVWTSAQASR